MALIGEAAAQGDVQDRRARAAQQGGRSFGPLLQDEVVR
jgi:hypothetical protein